MNGLLTAQKSSNRMTTGDETGWRSVRGRRDPIHDLHECFFFFFFPSPVEGAMTGRTAGAFGLQERKS